MRSLKEYRAIAAQAEQAVDAVKDPELKRIAFQKILESLIAADQEHASVPSPSPSIRRRRSSKSANVSERKKTGAAAYLTELVNEGFFKSPKTIAEVKAELANRGHHIPITSLSGPLQKKCQARVLRRQKVSGADKKATFAYSNW